MLEVKQAFEQKINTITPTIATAYENTTFTPANGVPYQELYLLPSYNDDTFQDSRLVNGIFQITLKYPTLKGNKDILERVKLYLDSFKSGDTITNGGIVVNVLGHPTVKNMGVIGDRVVSIISVNFWADYEMV